MPLEKEMILFLVSQCINAGHFFMSKLCFPCIIFFTPSCQLKESQSSIDVMMLELFSQMVFFLHLVQS